MWAGGVGVGEGRGPGMVLAHSLFSHALQGAGEVGTAKVGAVTELACISWEEEVLERLFILKGLHCLVVFHAWEPSVCSGWTYPSSSGWFCPDPGSRTLSKPEFGWLLCLRKCSRADARSHLSAGLRSQSQLGALHLLPCSFSPLARVTQRPQPISCFLLFSSSSFTLYSVKASCRLPHFAVFRMKTVHVTC